MANRFNYPRETALDSNGDPLGGAKLYFYESSTTKAADSFSDEGLGVANANPVVADSAGRFGDIWLKAQDYKVVLADADDVTIWTVDPVHGTLDVSGDDFKAGPQSPADMTVLVAAGSLYDVVLKALVARAAQTGALIAAPSSNPRRDIIHIDRLTGVVGIDTGTEAASPVDPAIADGKLPVARIALATTTTEITDSEITDIRELGLLGAIGGEHIQNQAFSYATAVGGTADAVTAAFSPALTALSEGMRLALKVATTNTGPSTLNVSGLGAVTVKKNDGATDLAAGDWTAGQIVEVEYDGTNFQMVSNVDAGAGTDVQTFTSSGTWNKPSGATRALVMLWGGGASGALESADGGGGGGGGAYVQAYFDIADLGATENVAIGAGGAARSGADADGYDGGNTAFGSLLTGYGGDGGNNYPNTKGGNGAAVLSRGYSIYGDDMGPGFGGGLGGADGGSRGETSAWGGGGGGGGNSSTGGKGGHTLNGGGGGGGGGGTNAGSGGTSVTGGDGGDGGAVAVNGTAGTQPAGGGGGSETGDSGAGGDGQCIVISW